MTEIVYSPKIKPDHLSRKAIVYLRQSSERQVRQNTESQLLQYAVAERVRALAVCGKTLNLAIYLLALELESLSDSAGAES